MPRWTVSIAGIALPLCLIAELLPIRSYSTADGLGADAINEIVADSCGFVWFCTPEDSRGSTVTAFVNFKVAEGLPHRSVSAVLETRSGEYLVGTARGLCQVEGRGKFTTYLLVKAVNSEGQESATPAEIDFTILPPVWTCGLHPRN